MNDAILKIIAIRKRMHRRVAVAANSHPEDAVIQSLAADDAALCEALREAITEHGPKVGVSPDVMTASVQPKD